MELLRVQQGGILTFDVLDSSINKGNLYVLFINANLKEERADVIPQSHLEGNIKILSKNDLKKRLVFCV